MHAGHPHPTGNLDASQIPEPTTPPFTPSGVSKTFTAAQHLDRARGLLWLAEQKFAEDPAGHSSVEVAQLAQIHLSVAQEIDRQEARAGERARKEKWNELARNWPDGDIPLP